MMPVPQPMSRARDGFWMGAWRTLWFIMPEMAWDWVSRRLCSGALVLVSGDMGVVSGSLTRWAERRMIACHCGSLACGPGTRCCLWKSLCFNGTWHLRRVFASRISMALD